MATFIVLVLSMVSFLTLVPTSVGASSFHEEAILFPFTGPEECTVDEVGIGDIDGDGEKELVVACEIMSDNDSYGHVELSAYGWTGSEFFLEWSTGSVVYDDTWGRMATLSDLDLYDVDDDNRDEIFIRGYMEQYSDSAYVTILMVLAWHPTGYEVLAIEYEGFDELTIADIDSDGHPEMYAIDMYGGMTVYEFSGTDPVWYANIAIDQWLVDVDVADIDSDQDVEVVIGVFGTSFLSYEFDNSEYTEDNNVSTTEYVGGAGHVSADFDSDGVVEVASAGSYGEVLVRGWNGTGFAEEWCWDVTSDVAAYFVTTIGVESGDLDGDGAPEIILANQILISDGVESVIAVGGFTGGAFSSEWVSDSYETGIRCMATGDLDGDGADELAVGSVTCGVVMVIGLAEAGQPYADFTVSPLWAVIGDRFTANASLSTDLEDGTDLQYRWDWEGDGIWDTDWSTESVTDHTYSASGVYAVMLEVMDSQGLVDIDVCVISVLEEDDEPPCTTLLLRSDSPVGTDGWTLGPVSYTLYAIDNGSGVYSTMVRIGDGEWEAGTSAYFIYDCWTNLSYYSVDFLGNAEEVKTVEVKIDTSSPISFVQVIAERGEGSWYVSETEVILGAHDYGSGVLVTRFRIDGGDWEDYTSPIILDATGEYSIDYYSVDVAGNEESQWSCEVSVDVDAPALLVSPLQDDLTASDSLTVQLDASDANGIDRFEVFFDGDGPMVYDGDTTNVSVPGLKSGTHVLTVVVYDVPGNSYEVSVTFDVSGVTGPGWEPWMVIFVVVAGASAAISAAYYFIMVWPERHGRPPRAK